MTRRTVLALCCTGLLGLPALAGDEPKPPACCAKKAAKKTTEKAGKLRCSLTGKEMDECCCIEREGKLHCTLAEKDVATCCCSEVKGEGKEPK